MAGRTVELNLQITRVDAFRRAEEALIIAGGIINFRDFAVGRIAATVPMSFKSFGETVEVDISGSDGDVRVCIESTSRLRTTLFEWGNNSDNVEPPGLLDDARRQSPRLTRSKIRTDLSKMS